MPAEGSGGISLLDTFRRSDLGAREIGGRGIVARAKDEQAAGFYQRWKFHPMPGGPLLLVIPMEMVRASLAAASEAAA